MTIDENRKLVLRYFQEAPRNPVICLELFQTPFIFHTIQHASVSPQDITSTPKEEISAYTWLAEVWSKEWNFSVDEVIAEGEKVMVQWTFKGTHQGDYYGLPPTGRKVSYSGINIFRISDGKIAEIWDLYDRIWLWQQLGVLPDIKDAIEKIRK